MRAGHPIRAAAICASLASVLSVSRPAAAQRGGTGEADPAPLLSLAATYIARFETAFSNIVAEERYEQSVVPKGPTRVGGPRVQHRELVSDFLLVRLPDPQGWVPFRDVFEVDKEPVRDRQDRLAQLLLLPETTAAARAAEMTEESARYNIGVVRTVNHPLLGFQVLRRTQQPRFRFTGLRLESVEGVRAAVIDYSEQTRPSLIKGPEGRDMMMHGRLWLEPASGRVLRTEVLVDTLGLSATIVTRFAYASGLDAAVPVEMREEYRRPNGDVATGLATYGHFRKFGVEVSDTVVTGRR